MIARIVKAEVYFVCRRHAKVEAVNSNQGPDRFAILYPAETKSNTVIVL